MQNDKLLGLGSMNMIKKLIKYILGFILILIVMVIAINMYVLSLSREGYFTDVSKLPKKEIGIVFGASVKPSGQPSQILKDRLDVAVSAYSQGKIEKIIVSGDNSEIHYNEPEAMKAYLITKGVIATDIQPDYAGFDTYQTIYRARDVFNTNEVVLFTQDFHLTRAMYIAKRLGLQTYGVETNIRMYASDTRNNIREVFAKVKAFLEVEVFKPKPTYLGDQIQIFTENDKRQIKKKILE